MLSITSPEIALQYRTNFFAMEQEIFQTYIEWLKGTEQTKRHHMTAKLLPILIPHLYETNELFRKIYDDNFGQSSRADLEQSLHSNVALNQCDAQPGTTPVNPAQIDNPLETAVAHTAPVTTIQPLTSKQKKMLTQRSIDGTDLTSREAYVAIGYLLEQEQLEKEETKLADTMKREHLEKKNAKRACQNQAFPSAQ
ncbi:hypothetical protein CVU75_03650 [Candidatus Dependentiae bacterium HGW-Dependentiae-1]|nr:MAG: hypothetical protein CVU75_03650 [Candidatus Dependentiae bacterium HGW-Dependentiae-1]